MEVSIKVGGLSRPLGTPTNTLCVQVPIALYRKSSENAI